MNNLKPKLFCLGVSHNSANMEFREALYIEKELLSEGLKILKQNFPLKEVAILSTCNRFEMFGTLEDSRPAQDLIYDAFLYLQKKYKSSFKFNIEQIQQNSFLYEEKDAIEHIFTVVSSLDSVVLGETQITGQFKDAIQLAKESSTVGPTLDRLAQEALTVTKKVRSQTAIGEKTVSISHAAIDLAKKVFVDLSKHQFLIIGAGEMAELAAKYATKYNPKKLMIANRTLSKAHELVQRLGVGEAYGLSELPDLLVQADIVISSTSAQGFVISEELARNVLSKKRGKTLFLVDIALPRDIDPACSKLDDLYLFEIDDLKQVVDKNIDERKQAAHAGLQMVEQHAKVFVEWLDSHAIKPTIAHYRKYLTDLFVQESEKTFAKSTGQQLTNEQKTAIKDMLDSIANKMIADVSRNLRHPPEGMLKSQLKETIDVLFKAKD